MNEKKDFLTYAKKRYGLPPRSIIQNTINSVFSDNDVLTASDKLRVVEYGFSHGNDARFLIDTMIAEIGSSGWEYWGFDHEEYFFADGILDYYDSKIKSNIHLVPCLFERIARGDQRIPCNVNLVYSSKSLSLCDNELFPSLMSTVLDSIAIGGYFVGTMHLNSQKQSHFWTVDDYMEMYFSSIRNDVPIFSSFDSQYEINAMRQTFAIFAKKTKRMRFNESDTLLVERNGGEYVEVSHEQ